MVKGKRIVRLQHSDKSGIIQTNGNIPNIFVSWQITFAGCVAPCEGAWIEKSVLIISEKEALTVATEASFSVKIRHIINIRKNIIVARA